MGTRRTPLRRVDGWSDRIDALVCNARQREYELGVWDCGVFAADAVVAMSGVDPLADDRDAYAERVAEYYPGDVEAFADTKLTAAGMVTVKPKFVRLGDIAAVDTRRGGALGVVLGAVVAVPGRPAGLEPVSTSKITKAWRVKE